MRSDACFPAIRRKNRWERTSEIPKPGVSFLKVFLPKDEPFDDHFFRCMFLPRTVFVKHWCNGVFNSIPVQYKHQSVRFDKKVETGIFLVAFYRLFRYNAIRWILVYRHTKDTCAPCREDGLTRRFQDCSERLRCAVMIISTEG